MKCLAKTVAAVVTTVTMCIPLTQTAVAAPAVRETNDIAISVETNDQLENDLRILFTRYIVQHNDTFTVNEQNVIADGYGDYLQNFYNAASVLNVYSESETACRQDRDAWRYTTCVLGKVVGLDFLSPNLIKTVTKAIQKADWKLAASLIGKALGKTVLKKLGGPVGIVFQLGIAAWQCRNQW